MDTPFGARILRWLNATSERLRVDPGDWQILGIHRSLRLTLSWLCQGRSPEDASLVPLHVDLHQVDTRDVRECRVERERPDGEGAGGILDRAE